MKNSNMSAHYVGDVSEVDIANDYQLSDLKNVG